LFDEHYKVVRSQWERDCIGGLVDVYYNKGTLNFNELIKDKLLYFEKADLPTEKVEEFGCSRSNEDTVIYG